MFSELTYLKKIEQSQFARLNPMDFVLKFFVPKMWVLMQTNLGECSQNLPLKVETMQHQTLPWRISIFASLTSSSNCETWSQCQPIENWVWLVSPSLTLPLCQCKKGLADIVSRLSRMKCTILSPANLTGQQLTNSQVLLFYCCLTWTQPSPCIHFRVMTILYRSL